MASFFPDDVETVDGVTPGTVGLEVLAADTEAEGRDAIDAQAEDADLTAIAGLATTGLIARTGAGTAATRSVASADGQITVANSDGVAGNPTMTLAYASALRETGASTTLAMGAVPAGTFLQRVGTNLVGADPVGQSIAYSVSTTNLVLDLDADAGVTISTGVSAWASQVGSLVAAQATGTKQPTVKEWGFGGHNCISFDGTDDIMLIPYAAASDWTTLTVYLVYRFVPNSSNSGTFSQVIVGRLFNTTAGTPWYEWSFAMAATTTVQMRFDGTATSNITMPRPPAYGSILTYTVGAAGSSGHQDGFQTHTGAATSITYSNNAGISIGGGAYTVEQEYAKCDIARILVYNVQHTPAQRHEVLTALRELYGTDPICRSETI